MVNTSTNVFNKEVSPVRKILALALIAVAILALTAAPALAEGYNDPLSTRVQLVPLLVLTAATTARPTSAMTATRLTMHLVAICFFAPIARSGM